MKDTFYNYILNLQNSITSKLEEVDGAAKFQEDIWKRPEGGGGRTRVIENGVVFEKRRRKYFCRAWRFTREYAKLFRR